MKPGSGVVKLVFPIVLATSVCIGCQSTDHGAEAIEQSNLSKAVYCMELLEVELDLEAAAEECFADSYIQHSPHVPDGRDGVLSYFAERIKNNPTSTIEIKRAAADGDLVWIHLHSRRTPQSLGNAVIHIFRMEDEKFAEHWAVSQPVPEESVHGNSMF